MAQLTRDELLSRKREQRLHNLKLYQQSLDEQRLREAEEAEQNRMNNRFYKKAFDKRQLNHSKIEQVLGMSLAEHSEIINKRIEKIKEEERQRRLEIDEALQRKRDRRLANLKPKRTRFPKKDVLEIRNVIEEKVNTFYRQFQEFAGEKTGTEFYAYSKSEEGAEEFEKLLEKYKRRISIISRKNPHVAELRKKIFSTYLINLV